MKLNSSGRPKGNSLLQWKKSHHWSSSKFSFATKLYIIFFYLVPKTNKTKTEYAIKLKKHFCFSKILTGDFFYIWINFSPFIRSFYNPVKHEIANLSSPIVNIAHIMLFSYIRDGTEIPKRVEWESMKKWRVVERKRESATWWAVGGRHWRWVCRPSASCWSPWRESRQGTASASGPVRTCE